MIYIKNWIEYYEDIFALEPNEINFYESYSKQFNSPAKFLSCECGTAELSQTLAARNNFDITVTDSFKEFISDINSKQSEKENPVKAFNINPIDISRYFGKEFFNVITCCNHRLIFLQDKTLVEKLLFDAKTLLVDGGYLILDLINFSKLDFSHPRIDLPILRGNNCALYSYILKDSETMKYYLSQSLVTNTGKEIDEVKHEVICPISLETFKPFAEKIGYSSIELYSDFNKTPFTPDSNKIICVLKK